MPRVGLDREAVVEAAIALADRAGIEGLTIKSLAQKLGVQPPSLYNHVESLEALRLLTNLETERHKLLQVVLFGQPELDATLARAEFRQLRQRITFSASLQPLNAAEVQRYVEERLQRAGPVGLHQHVGVAQNVLERRPVGG